MRQRLSHLLSPFSDEEATTLLEFFDRLDGVSGKLESQGNQSQSCHAESSGDRLDVKLT